MGIMSEFRFLTDFHSSIRDVRDPTHLSNVLFLVFRNWKVLQTLLNVFGMHTALVYSWLDCDIGTVVVRCNSRILEHRTQGCTLGQVLKAECPHVIVLLLSLGAVVII